MIGLLKKVKYIPGKLLDSTKKTISVMADEFRQIIRDPGVLIVFIGASLVYPVLYCSIYRNETLYDVPVAVVDDSHSARSRELIRELNATPELKVCFQFDNLAQAKKSFQRREIHGVIHIPSDYSGKIEIMQQATISTYSDMSSFLYYRAMTLATNYTVLNTGNRISIARLEASGVTGENVSILSQPLKFTNNILYNKGMGFASFLMPAILILIIHQTIFFGICMLAGTAREHNRFGDLLPAGESKRHLIRIVAGKSMGYFLLYFVMAGYFLGVIPRLFSLPHIGNPVALAGFTIPFLLAAIFFSMSISVFMRHRETGMVFLLFFSLILLFISGFSWPRSNIGGFWLAFGWLFPATHSIQGYLKISGMGASLSQIRFEYISLWIQTAFYFTTTIVAYNFTIRKSHRKKETMENSPQMILS